MMNSYFNKYGMTSINQRMFSSKIGGGAIEMENASDWDTYLDSETPIILQAGAGWCRPCTVLKPMIVNVAK